MIDYFLHIPKTGGTSFTHLIDSYYNNAEILPYQTWPQLLPHWPFDISKIKLVRGHFEYGIHRIFGRENMRYFTILRDPVKRVLSSYRHITVDYNSGRWPYRFKYRPINDIIFEYPMSFANVIVLNLARDVDYINDRTDLIPTNPLVAPWSQSVEESHEMYTKMNWEEKYSIAKNHLDSCIFVGFLENLQKSFDRLCEIMSWQKQKIIHKNMLRPQVDPVKPETLDKIKEITYWDQKLIDYAKEKWLNK